MLWHHEAHCRKPPPTVLLHRNTSREDGPSMCLFLCGALRMGENYRLSDYDVRRQVAILLAPALMANVKQVTQQSSPQRTARSLPGTNVWEEAGSTPASVRVTRSKTTVGVLIVFVSFCRSPGRSGLHRLRRPSTLAPLHLCSASLSSKRSGNARTAYRRDRGQVAEPRLRTSWPTGGRARPGIQTRPPPR